MKKKSLVMLMCALLIMSSVAFGTIAYLTDRADVTNKFTVGKVDIVVDETKVDKNGEAMPDPDYDAANPTPEHPEPNLRTEDENEYPLIPGAVYVKDPTMTIKAGSKDAYVRMMVTITSIGEINKAYEQLKVMYPNDEAYKNGFVPENCVNGWDSLLWPCTGYKLDPNTNTLTLEFRYAHVVNGDNGDTKLPSLFEEIKIPGELTNEQLATLTNLEIRVEGYAIQETGFADADEAWLAFEEQVKAEANVQGE